MRTVIQGGTIVNEGKTFDGAIVIEDGKIIAVAGEYPPDSSDEVIDASGCFVLPGIIDDHVHFREPGLTEKADIDTESCAAAAGGVTTYFDMPNTMPQTTTLEALAEKFALAAQKSHVNYSFFFGATNDNIPLFSQLDPHRIPGIKLFMGSSTVICWSTVGNRWSSCFPRQNCRSWRIARILPSSTAIWLRRR